MHDLEGKGFDEAAKAAGQNASPARSEAERGGSRERRNLACEEGGRRLVQLIQTA